MSNANNEKHHSLPNAATSRREFLSCLRFLQAYSLKIVACYFAGAT
jgi:hypothetical protein